MPGISEKEFQKEIEKAKSKAMESEYVDKNKSRREELLQEIEKLKQKISKEK
ncbi:hypothetical protein [Dolosigranulum pigrum]|uniref:hypothetical protein n=1 Tax=Dolosigranulum pigrum TaxID=29394 RepID=UPI001AD89B25|nr:hypothetical protein [Dolosigranulum pigrum]